MILGMAAATRKRPIDHPQLSLLQWPLRATPIDANFGRQKWASFVFKT